MKKILSNFQIDAPEIMFVLGIVMLFVGLIAWFGLPVALTSCGAVLVIASLMSVQEIAK